MRIKLDDFAIVPDRAHQDDAGLDLYSPQDYVIPARGSISIDTGVHVEIPKGYVGFITSKSGLMKNPGLTCRGTIDCGYTGSIKAIMFNESDKDFYILKGQKITQLVLVPCITPELEVVETLDSTERGDNGFGSTGRFK